MYKEITECRACGCDDLEMVLDLGTQPLANSYHKPEETLPEFPLALNVCRQCFHAQLSVVVNPDQLFRHYLYVSGTTQTLRDYFDWFAQFATMRFGDPEVQNGSVLDIACNDGSQLDSFRAMGWQTYGVDPARNLVPIAQQKMHKVLCGYWNMDTAGDLPASFDIITAQNVFAHTHDILGFLEACKSVMHENSLLYIQTSQANMILNGEFDTIYHEHLSFFNSLSMMHIVNRAGLHLNNVFKTDIHGTSYVFEISLDPHEGNLSEILLEERDKGLYDIDTYREFAKKANTCVTELGQFVNMLRKQGATVIGYGAAAKGMTVLNFGKIKLDYIIDDNPLKQDRLTPGMNIPIYSSDKLNELDGLTLIVPLAWNFYNEIKNRVKTQLGSKDELPPKLLPFENTMMFVRYFPKLTIEAEYYENRKDSN
jgi:2-polyprenyl-3-methyl-5-hydroxy-6-metoxy-1,4-benzoquinol methylase